MSAKHHHTKPHRLNAGLTQPHSSTVMPVRTKGSLSLDLVTKAISRWPRQHQSCQERRSGRAGPVRAGAHLAREQDGGCDRGHHEASAGRCGSQRPVPLQAHAKVVGILYVPNVLVGRQETQQALHLHCTYRMITTRALLAVGRAKALAYAGIEVGADCMCKRATRDCWCLPLAAICLPTLQTNSADEPLVICSV